ncbi:hypothetical protein EXIGLDRAFT_828634 [Exidia glandulosa HHB12029]|uniref:Uncharacterized protein n=1 Tax=Exidia glandulosa HHB12029 TaxID=1314781 RepID=A0A165Q970_EXIGL|nr:hypothetical protein EXIGLDRAFT_828634 [Exidia glandulosa HHB12029]
MIWTQLSIAPARLVALDTIRKMGVQATFSSQELYDAVHKHFADVQLSKNLRPPLPGEPRPPKLKEKIRLRVQPVEGKLPPHPEHPIRSQRYFKRIVLDDLENRGILKKVHTFRDPTEQEIAERDQRVRTLRVFPRHPVTGKRTSESPLLLKKVDVWQWHITPAGAELLEKGEGVDVRDARKRVLGRKAAAALAAQLREDRLCGPRLVVWE